MIWLLIVYACSGFVNRKIRRKSSDETPQEHVEGQNVP